MENFYKIFMEEQLKIVPSDIEIKIPTAQF